MTENWRCLAEVSKTRHEWSDAKSGEASITVKRFGRNRAEDAARLQALQRLCD
jgi:hypothetical protein